MIDIDIVENHKIDKNKKNISKYFIAFIFVLGLFNLRGQQIKVFNTFEDLDSTIFKQNDTTYIINFWATWCKPCVKELPYFEMLHTKNRDQIIKVILVSLDFRKQLESKLLPLLVSEKITAQVYLLDDKDYNRWLSKVDESWSGSIPSTLLIKGKRKLFTEQEFDHYETLKNYVFAFINQP